VAAGAGGKAFKEPTILPRKGEVAGSCQTEGAVSGNVGSVSSPSVTFGATSPWRGRIVKYVDGASDLRRYQRVDRALQDVGGGHLVDEFGALGAAGVLFD